MVKAISIPKNLLPTDGRFGAGPSLIRNANVEKLVTAPTLGTSHRSKPVKDKVSSIASQLHELLNIPSDYLVTFGNGGATTFWSVATCSLAKDQAAHAAFGAFGKKFFQETQRAPHLKPSLLSQGEAGTLATLPSLHPGKCSPNDLQETAHIDCDTIASADLFAYPHHETSTGVISPLYRVVTNSAQDTHTLTVVDATSIAGAVAVDLNAIDAYYFSPQKCFGSDGGLWIAIISPAAIERAQRLCTQTQSQRWIPDILNLKKAIDNSQKNQTLNTPAITTLELLDNQLQWMLSQGGIEFCENRVKTSSHILYEWAEKTPWATPFVTRPQWRSPVVVTIDIEGFAVEDLHWILRQHNIVDIGAYRSLGRNQIRIAVFPAVDPADVQALTECLSYVGNRLFDAGGLL
ncbi:MAG: phosphoserine transaminase [Actinomycetaceae bacterium]|nr:phosphoserine transaminase [Actinomycetaceae bacterium]MDO5746993.1 phosphoserine transaminase [Actinomycetaceae bacterium]